MSTTRDGILQGRGNQGLHSPERLVETTGQAGALPEWANRVLPRIYPHPLYEGGAVSASRGLMPQPQVTPAETDLATIALPTES